MTSGLWQPAYRGRAKPFPNPHLPHSPSCPFCAVAAAHPPFPPSRLDLPINPQTTTTPDSGPPEPQTHLILSTKHVLAFLDIMPLTRGHVLVVSRGHYENLGNVGVEAGSELGKWLTILSRVVVRTVLGTELDARGEEPAHWNVVQNNGARASQTVPHVHFHIIPRPPLDTRTPTKGGWRMFGRGQRDELDDDEAQETVALLRAELAKEVIRVKEEEGVDLDLDGYLELWTGRRMEKL
ncbi:HIT domain-containing protein [Paracoccidioides lutzii Pb01]|uniref:HIT domain-containing protein n=1 Tax=Paracoccidioides lutzii (strain ATCC MYA-826 / Pb01) TaxID=502779 RepID=C1GW92_PARBA|nr:HIT domain-containing protein [Paracoccidioides lutzii Pb01]EEH40811.1 HIT domain-containing protein [Paracoccidioides lutzii Pb01]